MLYAAKVVAPCTGARRRLTLENLPTPNPISSEAARPWVVILLIAIGTWALTAAIVGLVMTSPAYAAVELSSARATFQATSVVTLTGFAVSWSDVADLHAGHRWAITLGTAFSTLCAWAVTLSILQLATRSTQPQRVGVAMAWLIGGYVFILALATAYTWFATDKTAAASLESSLSRCVFALGGSGMRWAGEPSREWLWSVGFPLVVAGLLWPWFVLGGQRMLVKRTTVSMAACFLVVAVVYGGLGFLNAQLVGRDVRIFEIAATLLDARVAGLTQPLAEVAPATRWLTGLIALLGSAPGSTGAGAGVLAIAVLATLAFQPKRADTLPVIAVAWQGVLVIGLLWAATFGLLLAMLPQLPADRVAVLAAGAVGNVGISVDPVDAADADAFVLSAAMLLGRIASLAMLYRLLAAMTRSRPKPDDAKPPRSSTAAA